MVLSNRKKITRTWSFGLAISATTFILITFLNGYSQNKVDKPQLIRVLFILDASNSMNGLWQSGRKSKIAEKLLSQALDSLRYTSNVELGLRVYGHLKNFPPQDCDDSKLEVPFGLYNVDKIKQKLHEITPRGTTPIAMSLELAANDFPPCKDCRNIIILITDGIEECRGDPCAVSLALQRKGIILKPFVIGIGLDMHFKESFKCVGNYYDAADEKSFRHVLNIVISQALNSTTAQVNLLDEKGMPTESNVNMTFYDWQTGIEKYNYIHAINNRGNPDTINLDPVSTYRMVVHTIPEVEKDSIKLVPGKHNIIAIDVPQGFLSLHYSGINQYRDLKAIIRKAGEQTTLHVQNFNTKEKYITGTYDIEILSLPRIILKNVQVSQSHTTDVEIPQPGLITFLSNSEGYGSIYIEDGNDLVWVCRLNHKLNKQSLTIQPGRYKVVFRPKNAKASVYTIEKRFVIEQGSSTAVKLY